MTLCRNEDLCRPSTNVSCEPQMNDNRINHKIQSHWPGICVPTNKRKTITFTKAHFRHRQNSTNSNLKQCRYFFAGNLSYGHIFSATCAAAAATTARYRGRCCRAFIIIIGLVTKTITVTLIITITSIVIQIIRTISNGGGRNKVAASRLTRIHFNFQTISHRHGRRTDRRSECGLWCK